MITTFRSDSFPFRSMNDVSAIVVVVMERKNLELGANMNNFCCFEPPAIIIDGGPCM